MIATSVKSLFTYKLEELLGPSRKRGEELTQHHRDIAHSAQAMYEEAFFISLIQFMKNSKLIHLVLEVVVLILLPMVRYF